MFSAVLVSAVLTATPSLAANITSVAALRGEPGSVSAAGLAADETPILTIENGSAFDPAATHRRLVLVGADDAPAADAVVAAVRWLKTTAPRSIRDRWVCSALPMARFPESDKQSLSRWLTFQAADLVVEIGAGGSVHLDDVRTESIPAAAAIPSLQRLLAGDTPRSALHEAIVARIRRGPLDIARLLAKHYPETPAISYIPAVAWVNTLRLAAVTGDDSLRARVVEQTTPWLLDGRKMFGDRIQLTAVAGTIVFDAIAAERQNAISPQARQAAIALSREGRELAAAEKSAGVALYGGGWTDDMFMSASVLAWTGQWPGGEKDLDVAARLLTAYAGRLQRPDGLFNHAIDGPAAWGRGNGFAAMGLAEALTAMPAKHPQRSR